MPFSSIKKNQYILLDGFHLLLADVFFKKAKKKKKKKKKKRKYIRIILPELVGAFSHW
jgi:adenosyl cobinamide kinase/adenosyl cobinamide phosphate guanylyltransferase